MNMQKRRYSDDVIAKNRSHYNFASDAWRFIFGDNFHWGFFKSGEADFLNASYCLIDELARLATFTRDSKILDVGCGIGGPAFYLYEKFKCRITGISTSERGVELANRVSSEKGYSDKVQFQLANALDNGFPDNTFDIVWVMESAHLIPDKREFMDENFRVLKKNGTMLLCDHMVRRKLNADEIFHYYKELRILGRTFGWLRNETIGFYHKAALEAGFYEVKTVDITKQVFPTLEHLRKNLKKNYTKIRQYFSQKMIDEFFLSCDILENFTKKNINNYKMLKAVKK